MANPVPSVYYPGVTLSSGNLVFTTSNVSPGPSTFPRLTNAEANETTGDIRKLAYAILMDITDRHINFSPVSQRPNFAASSSQTSTRQFPYHTRTITFTFTLAPSGAEDVAPEPA